MDQSERGTAITTAAELEQLIGHPEPRVAEKVRIATSDARGDLDVSPKGDPAGFATVLDKYYGPSYGDRIYG